MTQNVAIKLLMVFSALFLLLGVAQSLDESEVEALGQILETFPALGSLPRSLLMAYPDPYGKIWDVPLHQICTLGDSWLIHGIHCNAYQLIDAIVMYAHICSSIE